LYIRLNLPGWQQAVTEVQTEDGWKPVDNGTELESGKIYRLHKK
jgi:hypothetical protein